MDRYKTILLFHNILPMIIAVCCLHNQNRSMAIHDCFLRNNHVDIRSFGTSTAIRLPGETPDKPNTYTYEMSYEEIYEDLVRKNKRYYEKIGVLQMLERNMRIKKKPENIFDSASNSEKGQRVDLVIASDMACFKRIYDSFKTNGSQDPSLLVGFDILDTLNDAMNSAQKVYDFVADIETACLSGKTFRESVCIALKNHELERIIITPLGIKLSL